MDANEQRAQVTAQDKQQASEQVVAVRSLPPIDTIRDGVDYAQIVLTLIVMGLAVWQIVLLQGTLSATEKAALAAEKSARIAEQTMVSTQRAYVTTSFPQAEIIVVDGELVVEFSVSITNNGSTPALDAIHRMTLAVTPPDFIPAIETLLGPSIDQVATFIPPHTTTRTGSVRSPMSTFIAPRSVVDQKLAFRFDKGFFCLGWSAYRDVFGIAHTSQFCFRLTALAIEIPRDKAKAKYDLPVPSGYRWTWQRFGEFNRVDESCQLYKELVELLPKGNKSDQG